MNELNGISTILHTEENKQNGLTRLKDHLYKHPENKLEIHQIFGIYTIFLQEITGVYSHLNKPEIQSNICIVLEIMIEMCELKEFRDMSIQIQLPLFLYPILNTSETNIDIEKIKAMCMDYIRKLLEVEGGEVYLIEFFKNTELVPLCLRNMELGNEESKLAAARVFYSILCVKEGLEYVCQTYDRFMATSIILNSVLVQMETIQSAVLLEIIIKTYRKLCDMPNAKVVFAKNRPHMLYSEYIRDMVRQNTKVKAAYEEFLNILQT
ncbi:CCR4-NOT transcription complex subunit 9 [Nematocida sp. AWRm80]|nr:CCR4-NOT transcription complex subunit 9 [Nematocida sp. AWRm80]